MELSSSETERVRAHAMAQGFDAVRFTTADAPAHGAFADAWIAADYHGEMGYLRRRHALRSGPLDSPDLLDGARSVIVVALSYAPVLPPNRGARGTGMPRARGAIARYARGDDYHPVVWEKLDALGAWLAQTYPGARSRGFCDSGPLRERELAARAGLGWTGKHTGLISLDLGNWFFLGALLTTLAFPPDPPVSSHCGTCTRCLAACPTGALLAPMALDARRCISYLTIELKGPIPEPLRPAMGDRIFGCDDCLAACPWNERARTGREARLAARDADAAHPDLIALLALLASEGAFRERFRGTPLQRPGRAGLRRNVCVALGNVGGAEALGPLQEVAAHDPSEMVREHALWAIGRIREAAP